MAISTANSAATTLDDIITELRLNYDSSVGLLDGDNVNEIPSVNTLLNLNKLLTNLSNDLSKSINVDSKVISLIESRISKKEKEELEDRKKKLEEKKVKEIEIKESKNKKKRESEDEIKDEKIETKRQKLDKKQNNVKHEEEIEEDLEDKDLKEDVEVEEEEEEKDNDVEDKEDIPGEEKEDEKEDEKQKKKDVGEEGVEVEEEKEEEDINDKETGKLELKDGTEPEKKEEPEEDDGEAEVESEQKEEEQELDKYESKEESKEENIEDGDKMVVDEDKKDEDKPESTTSETKEDSAIKPETEDKEEVGSTAPRERLNSSDDPVPPVQTGHYTQDNDTRLKNPKSEFVQPQTLSATAVAELGLFSEDNNGFETHGKEYLKKKYGVASYPENDLKDLLPGEIPNIDFSKTKAPNNQVQFTTFQSYIESFYRSFSTDDLKFLNEKHIIPPGFEKQNYDPDVSPYIIPKLGQFYADVWTEEDASLGNKLNSPAFQQSSLDNFKPKGNMNDLEEDKLITEEISCGPLSSRLLSAILSIHEGVEEEDENNSDINSKGSKTDIDTNNIINNSLSNSNSNTLDENIATDLRVDPDFDASADANDFHSIEERLKRELKYIGIFMNLPNPEDDEINNANNNTANTSNINNISNSKNKLNLNGRPIKSETRSGNIIDNDDWVRNKEDDEVSAEIRLLQKQLKESSTRNRQNKKKLIPIVEEQIAYQEYCTILEDLDKQVDQAYLKRLRSKNKKKKATEKVELTPAQQQAINAGIRSVLDKRQRWIENIGKLFPPPEKMKRVPSEPVLNGDIEEEIDDEVNDVAQDVIQDRS